MTRVGRVLRASQLDELPQLWNVLRGNMSVVGPRPIRPVFFEELCVEIPQYWQRLVVRPGLTGFAQLRMARDMSWAEKLAHDLEYLADRSVGLYLRSSSPPPGGSSGGAGERRAAPRRPAPDVCGICGLAAARRRAADDARGRRDDRARSPTAAPTARACVVDGPVALGAAGWRSSTSRTATSRSRNEDGTRRRRPERRDLQPRGAARGAARARAPLRHALRHRGPRRTPTRSAATRSLRAPARHVRDRALGRARAAAAARPRPVRHQAAVLAGRGRRALVRLGAEGAAPAAGLPRRARPDGAGGVPRVQLRSRRRCRSSARCASCRPATC